MTSAIAFESTDRSLIDGHFPVHAVRRHPPQAGHTYFQGQVLEHGYMVVGAG